MGASRTLVAACCMALSAAAAPARAAGRVPEGPGLAVTRDSRWPVADGRARLSAEGQDEGGTVPASPPAPRRARLAFELATPLSADGAWAVAVAAAAEQSGAAVSPSMRTEAATSALNTAEAWLEGPLGPAWLAVGLAQERWDALGQAGGLSLRTWGEVSADDRWSGGHWLAAFDHEREVGIAAPTMRLALGWHRDLAAGHGLGLTWSRPMGALAEPSGWRLTYRLALP